MSPEAPALPVVGVECHAGYRGEETPRRFRLGERQIEIAEVVDSWLAPDHRYFKVHDTEGDLYILRNDVAADRWALTWFRRSADDGASPLTRPGTARSGGRPIPALATGPHARLRRICASPRWQ